MQLRVRAITSGGPWLAARLTSRRPPESAKVGRRPDHCQVPAREILDGMSKTSVEVDRDIASEAAAVLGTTTLRDTIDASLREIVNAKRRIELIALLRDTNHYDFDTIDDAWGGKD